MQTVTVESIVNGRRAAEVYERLKDPDVYARYAPDQVKSVLSEPAAQAGETVTHWEIYFRNGLLCWSERDFYDDERNTLRFEQIDGDFDVFHGVWAMTDHDEGLESAHVRLSFEATFDFGVPSLESIIEPVAVRVLRQSMSRIISSLFGGVVLEPTVIQGH